MAEKLETTLARGTASVTHRGKEVTIDLPECIAPDEETFFSKDRLLAFAEKHGVTLALLQDGLAQALIRVRATARPDDLPPEKKGGSSRPQEIEASGAQSRVDAWAYEARSAGKKPLTREDKRKELKKMGFNDKQIEALFAAEGGGE